MTRAALELPQFTTPEELAGHAGWSERKVREIARKIGACRIVGNRMLLTQTDVDAILEASRPCPSKSTVEAKSGITVAPSLKVDGGYEALQKLRRKTERLNTLPASKPESGKVITMARNRS